jgi:hypothetical protein
MTVPQLLNDIIRFLLLLAPSAALASLVFAGISLRKEGGSTFWIGGGFSRWMFWAVVMITLPQILSWFGSLGIGAPLPRGGLSVPWLTSVQADISSFVANFIVGRLVPTIAAFFVLRAILDTADGGHPLPSVLTAMFLLAVPATFALLSGFNSGTSFATVDVLDSLWNYLVGRIMPVAAGLAVIGAIVNFATQRPAMRLIACSLAFLTVSAIWKLIQRMML